MSYSEVKIRLWIHGLDCPKHYRLTRAVLLAATIYARGEFTSKCV
ncbi:MAG: hypothetical protein ACXAEX_16080 [Promethearchaeota archaeon]